jgi:hypothetical protein
MDEVRCGSYDEEGVRCWGTDEEEEGGAGVQMRRG